MNFGAKKVKHNKRDCFAAAIGAALFLAVEHASAGLVHIQVQQRAGMEFGAGYTVGRGSDCFVVTPFHVVQFAGTDSITVTDAKGSSAKARLLKRGIAAALRCVLRPAGGLRTGRATPGYR